MGYPDILPGNDGSRSRETSDLTLQAVLPRGRRGGVTHIAATALIVVVAIGTLVVKPWDRFERGDAAAAPQATLAVAAESAPPAAAVPSIAPIEVPTTIEPDRWAQLSASLQTANADGVVFVARYRDSLFYAFQPVNPSAYTTAEAPETDGTSNTVRATGYLGSPVALGITRATASAAPITVGWRFLDRVGQTRLAMTHPVGDVDRDLFIGLWLPTGERNISDVSRQPPEWQAGTYRFDLIAADGTRHVFVILDP